MLKKLFQNALGTALLLATSFTGAAAAALDTRSGHNLVTRTLVPTSINTGCQTLLVGQHATDGTVCLTIVGANTLSIVYSAVSGYDFTDAHVWLGTGIPTTTAPGQFNFNTYCTVSPKLITCLIPFTAMPTADICDNTLWYIATHAALVSTTYVAQTDTGWAGTNCITGTCKPWARYFTFQVICTTPIIITPPPGTCSDTAFGYLPGAHVFDYYGIVNARWGWVLEVTTGALPILGYIWAGVGQNDLSHGTLVGQFVITKTPSGLTIFSTLNGPLDFGTTHVYISDQPPITSAPGLYGNQHLYPGAADTSDRYTFTQGYLGDLTAKLYIILHYEVNGLACLT